MKIIIIIFLSLTVLIWINTMSNSIQIKKLSTQAEVITIVDSIIKADTLSIYSKNYQTFIESYTLMQALVLKGDLPVEKLQPYIDWLLNREEMRQDEAREKFED